MYFLPGLQINMTESGTLSGVVVQGRQVVVQGRQDKAHWVTSFKIGFSADMMAWNLVENGRIFKGNDDNATKVAHHFDRPVEARHVRIYPESWWDRLNDLSL